MRMPLIAGLCDAIELATLAQQKSLTIKDLVQELTTGTGLNDQEATDLVTDAIGLAVERAKLIPSSYPFDVNTRQITPRARQQFNAYEWLLLGSSLGYAGANALGDLQAKFRKHFEDLVCWCFRRAGFLAEVLSEPRAERNLPTQLAPALVEVASRFGEGAQLDPAKLSPHDNDLGVDIIATHPVFKTARTGRPIFLIQCATGAVNDFSNKLGEKEHVFCGVWSWGFYASTSIRGAATPDDLIRFDKVHWDRWCDQGWVLDRVRLVQLADTVQGQIPVPQPVQDVAKKLSAIVKNLDWRNGWRASL